MSSRSKNTLSGILVGRAMRRQVNRLPQETSISTAINTLIKYKVNALMATDKNGQPTGVLSKTDIIGAYYADLPIESPIEFIMASPPLFCQSNTPLEKALDLMRQENIYRLYVRDPNDNTVIGVLAYPDIVGMLYQHCHECEYNTIRMKNNEAAHPSNRLLVSDAMSTTIKSVTETDNLQHVLEELSLYKMGAILVKNDTGQPAGVISKTDLILSYKHKTPTTMQARSVMSTPVQVCKADDLMEKAIRTMIFNDVHRLFVEDGCSKNLVGVFSLSDAARSRSGSCRACISSRITLVS